MKKNLFWGILMLILFACDKNDEQPPVVFKVPLGSTSDISYRSVVPTKDGYVLSRSRKTTEFGTEVTKFETAFADQNGVIQEVNELPLNDFFNCGDIITTRNGDVVSVGTINDPSLGPYGTSAFIARFDGKGKPVWTKTIPSNVPLVSFYREEIPYNVVETSDNRLVVAIGFRKDYGPNYENNTIICLNGQGNILWQKLLPPVRSECRSMIAYEDGSVILSHQVFNDFDPNQNTFLLITKIDQNGNVLWTQSTQDSSYPWAGLTTLASDIYFTIDNLGASEAYAMYKSNTSGTISLIRNFTTMSNPHTILTTDDNRLLVFGYAQNSPQAQLVKSDGTEIWFKPTNANGYNGVKPCPDGGFVYIDGNTLYKTDKDLNYE
jgi:hypothetical protein